MQWSDPAFRSMPSVRVMHAPRVPPRCQVGLAIRPSAPIDGIERALQDVLDWLPVQTTRRAARLPMPWKAGQYR